MATVVVTSTDNLQTLVNANPGLTTFSLTPGTYTNPSVIVKGSNSFLASGPGVIFDGTNTTQYAFYANSTTQSTVTIRGFEIKNYNPPQQYGAITCDAATGWLVEDMVVHDCSYSGIRIGPSAIVRRCTVYRNGVIGLSGFQAHGTVVEDSEFYENNWLQAPEQPINAAASGVKFGETGTLTVQNNFIHHNLSHGLWTDHCHAGNLLSGNRIEDNTKAGIMVEISCQVRITNNICRRNALGQPFPDGGIKNTSSINVEVDHNLCEDNERAIVANQAITRTWSCGTTRVENFNVHDNTCQLHPTRIGQVGVTTTSGETGVFTWNNQFVNNTYRAASATGAWFLWNGQNLAWAAWQAVPQDATGSLGPIVAPPPSGTTKLPLTLDRLLYRGRCYLPGGLASSSGQTAFGKGIALRKVGTEYRLYVNTFMAQPETGHLIEYRVPSTFSGQLTFLRDLGSITTADAFQRYGVFWDEIGQAFYFSTGVDYASSSPSRRVIARATISPTTGLLVKEAEWKIATTWSWRAVMGGMTAVPQWFNDAYLGGTKRLAAGFGGYFSVMATGPVSMGPSLAALPVPSVAVPEVTVTPLQGFPFSGAQLSVPRQHRPTNYTQYFENCTTDSIAPGFHPQNNPALVPMDPTIAGTGYWTWTDALDSGGCWIDLTNVSGMLYAATLGESCCWYGNNWGFVNPCSGTVGKAAAINSSRKAVYLFVTNPDDLAVVAQGANPASIQAAPPTSRWVFANLPESQPWVGWPTEIGRTTGLSNVGPILVVGLYQGRGAVGGNQPWYYFYEIDDTTTGPPPLTAPTLWKPGLGATGVTDATTTGSVVRWNPSSQATDYLVYHGTTTPPPLLTTLTVAAAASPSFPGTCETAVVRTPNVHYYWQVSAVRSGLAATSARYDYTTAPAAADPLVIVTTTFGTTQAAVPYSVTAQATGGVPPYTWTFSGLPTGLTATSAGVISGTANVPGTYSVQTTVTDTVAISTGPTAIPLVVTPNVVARTPALGLLLLSGPAPSQTVTAPTVFVATPSERALTVQGRTPVAQVLVYTSVSPGVRALALTGQTPSRVLTTPLVLVRAPSEAITHLMGPVPTRTVAAAPLVVDTTTLPAGTTSVPYGPVTLAGHGGVPPYTWTAVPLPPGLTCGTTGVLTGTPTTAGTTSVLVTVTDTRPASTATTLPLVIAAGVPPLTLVTTTLPEATVGVQYQVTLVASGGVPPYQWSAGALPEGLQLTSSGVLQGMPTTAGTASWPISVWDTTIPATIVTADLPLTIVGPPPVPIPPPGVPQVYLPRNKATRVTDVTTNGPYVRWFGVPDTDTYQVYHGTSPNPPFLGSVPFNAPANIADYPGGTYYFAVTRAARTTYYWRIVAVNAGGITSSPVWKYKTK